LLKEVERKRKLPGDAEGNLIRETMDRDKLIEDLHTIDRLLDGLIVRTQEKLDKNRKIRKLLKLPQTVHNKTRITNYIKNGTQ
jgi:hypothetical protein|tara:strand:+ start:204 stop:452 length:249 start_codon:yes stop_codon:yes gene_type:complete